MDDLTQALIDFLGVKGFAVILILAVGSRQAYAESDGQPPYVPSLDDDHDEALEFERDFKRFSARFRANIAAGYAKICPRCREVYTWTCESCAGYVEMTVCPVCEREHFGRVCGGHAMWPLRVKA